MLPLIATITAFSTADLAEARISLAMPGPARLVQAGAQADLPQSAERKAWEATGDGLRVTVTYERWRSPQFAPEVMLDRFARLDLGLIRNVDVEETSLDGHTAALMRVQDPEGGLKFMMARARSGAESWQVRVEAMQGGLDAAAAEAIFNSVQITVRPERAGAVNEFGLPPVINGVVQPTPEPEAWIPLKLEEANLMLNLPFALVPGPGPTVDEKSPFSAVHQWTGRRGDMNITITHTSLKPGFRINSEAWEASMVASQAQAGLPVITAFDLEGTEIKAQAMLFAPTAPGGTSTQIILFTQGGKSWAIQTKAIADDEGGEFHRRLRESLRIG